MRSMSRAVAFAAVLTSALVSSSRAQGATAGAPTMTGPDWSLYGGVASGDNPYDIGIAVGASGRWLRSDWPVAARGDLYFARHSGDIGVFDLSVNMVGVMGSAEYSFPTTNRLKPYAFGGLGLFYSNVNSDYVSDDYDSSTDLGFGFGGGISFTPKFGIELRFMNIGGFNTVPILAAFRF
jgi:opacity protein-like surface antigen